MHRAKKGVFITTSSFSKDAFEYVGMIEKRIVLVDGAQLTELMLTHNLGVSTKHVFEVKALDSDYFLGNLHLLIPIKGLHNVKFYSVLNIEERIMI